MERFQALPCQNFKLHRVEKVNRLVHVLSSRDRFRRRNHCAHVRSLHNVNWLTVEPLNFFSFRFQFTKLNGPRKERAAGTDLHAQHQKTPNTSVCLTKSCSNAEIFPKILPLSVSFSLFRCLSPFGLKPHTKPTAFVVLHRKTR